VGVVERLGNIRGDAYRRLDRQLLLGIQPVAEGLPFHLRHDVEEVLAGHPGIEKRQDVGGHGDGPSFRAASKTTILRIGGLLVSPPAFPTTLGDP
jgi:hypothetical protein